ncbi:MAG: HpcH/HpaI aldolase/citrate lyase family protein [Hyphomicrobiaceae bacterium]
MRSMLFVPGDSERKFSKSLTVGADGVILDLEDSIAPDRKSEARRISQDLLQDARSRAQCPLLYVRINALDTDDWIADLSSVMPARPDGIVLPKPRSGEDVHQLAVALDHAETEAGSPRGCTKILPIVTELALSVVQLPTYVGCSSRMIAMSWGAEDLSSDLGATTSRDENGELISVYRFVRDSCLLTAVAAGVQPMDTVFVSFRDDAALAKEAREAARDGFTGKIAIHPSQVGIINAAFTPSAQEIARAERIVAIFADRSATGVASLDGEMLDRPHLVRAQRILDRAHSAKVASTGDDS